MNEGLKAKVLRERAEAFLDLAKSLERTDLASFHAEQAAQLRLKSSILRLVGKVPRVHGIRELAGFLAKSLSEEGFEEQALKIREFVRRHKEELMDLEDAYSEARYELWEPSRTSALRMIRAVEELFKVLDEVEKDVLG
ncbi:MAG: HEPN domain-containing protein [Crenarchaeota archaeon]|nr:HEPN domain-containing protein [Thermoproteota archaeon]